MIDQTSAPLWEALVQHISTSKGNFHVPGHKAGQVFDSEGLSRFAAILAIDRTETGNLDDLHSATGVIREAEDLAAEAFGADRTKFLVGGTTAGNLATILSLCGPNDLILVQRSCHQSVFHACMLAGAKVVPISSQLDETVGMELPLSISDVDALLLRYPATKAVVVTSPSYFGIVQPIAALAELVHKRNIPLIVDEAHGAHFGFHSELPQSAVYAGADVVIQSTHKMLTSMTMSSMLHMKGSLINKHLIEQYLRMIQSSSPSYPLMASLDLARRQIVLEGEKKLDQVLTLLSQLRSRIGSCSILEEQKPVDTMDPFKLSLTTKGRCTGYELAEMLEARGIYIELADDEKVLLVFSLATCNYEIELLTISLLEIETVLVNRERKQRNISLPALREGELIPYAECRTKGQKLVPIVQSANCRCAVQVVPYPPGIPVILMGELISQEVVSYLLYLLQIGANIRGIQNVNQQYCILVYI